MVRFLILNLLFLYTKSSGASEEHDKSLSKSVEDMGNLVTSLRDDANLDLTEDEEYEDLRAELLAYHTALASLTSSRRSLTNTPCWKLGGICINHKLCTGFRYLTEVPGCKNKLNVCCFAWNNFKVRDWRDKGIGNLALPWSLHNEFGGKGILDTHKGKKQKKKGRKELKIKSNSANKTNIRTLALIIKAD